MNEQLEIVEDHVSDAVERGAKVRAGGHRLNDSQGWFHEPTVVTGVDHSMKLMRDETFGPVLPIMTFKTDEEAVRLANDSIYGLTASVFTGDFDRGKRIAEQIDAGTVMVNEVVYTHAVAQTPWGGVKQSGYGRTHGTSRTAGARFSTAYSRQRDARIGRCVVVSVFKTGRPAFP